MADVDFIITGLGDVEKNIKQIANILTTPGIEDMLYGIGSSVRNIARNSVNNAVYRTPESKNYKRTRFLYETIYIATSDRSDYDECFARGLASAQAIYPKRDTTTTYQMLPQLVPPDRSVIVVAGSVYAEYVEYGNGHVGPRPFMRPAQEKAGPISVRSVDAFVRQFLSRAAGRATRTAGGQFASRY